MPNSADIISRIRDRFLDQVLESETHSELAQPLGDELSDVKTLTAPKLVALYEHAVTNSNENEPSNSAE